MPKAPDAAAQAVDRKLMAAGERPTEVGLSDPAGLVDLVVELITVALDPDPRPATLRLARRCALMALDRMVNPSEADARGQRPQA